MKREQVRKETGQAQPSLKNLTNNLICGIMKKEPIQFEQFINGRWVISYNSKQLIKGYEARIKPKYNLQGKLV